MIVFAHLRQVRQWCPPAIEIPVILGFIILGNFGHKGTPDGVLKDDLQTDVAEVVMMASPICLSSR
jgi:hypothetical protein